MILHMCCFMHILFYFTISVLMTFSMTYVNFELLVFPFYIHTVFKLLTCISVFVFIFTLCLGLKLEVSTVLRICNVHHYYSLCVHIIHRLVICIAICVLRIFLHWLGLVHHLIWFMVTNVLQEHPASIITIFTGHWKMESVYSYT